MRWRPARAQRSVDRGARGPAIEPRKLHCPGRRRGRRCGRQYRWRRYRESSAGPAWSENPCTCAISSCREPGGLAFALASRGPRGERLGGNPSMNEREKSDGLVVPVKPPNNAALVAAEVVEGRGLREGNAAGRPRPGLRAGVSGPSALGRVRDVAQKDKEARFTALLHHVDVDRLREAYRALNPKAATGVDGVTWLEYGVDLEENLRDLHARVHRGSYRARPSRRAYIPKPDGRQRPLGIAALEDKILQRAVVEVLNAIYEAD